MFEATLENSNHSEESKVVITKQAVKCHNQIGLEVGILCNVLEQERQELGERVMVTRLHLFNKWVKVNFYYTL